MDPLIQLISSHSAAHTVFILCLVIALGLALGSLRFFRIQLGVAGVLFSGIFLGHFKVSFDHEILEFVREFGLILFVYTIGVQVGPSFFSSFKREGLRLNAWAACIVIAGAVVTVCVSKLFNIPFPVASGMFSGATTNTPSLAAAQQALQEIPSLGPDALKMPGLGYAVCYPFGIFGVILSMILVRVLFGIHLEKENQNYIQMHARQKKALEIMDLKVENQNLNGCTMDKIPFPEGGKAVISRILHEGKAQIVMPDTQIFCGDFIRVVGEREHLDDVRLIIGSRAQVDWEVNESIVTKTVLVTRREVVGKNIGDLDPFFYGVTVTRISRSEIEFAAVPEIEINYADTLVVVGDEKAITKFASIVGNSVKELNHPELIPIFVGIAIGVVLGSWPVTLPGMPAPIKLGLAGGPLLVAMILSRIGRIGKLIWYMPTSANFMLREIGIALFLACVGLKSGDKFLETLLAGQGMQWMLGGIFITFLPIFAVALFLRYRYKMNYLTLCGFLAGSMTDPPALAFANQIYPSTAQVVSYAAVYPVVMILRVIIAQLLVMLFAH